MAQKPEAHMIKLKYSQHLQLLPSLPHTRTEHVTCAYDHGAQTASDILTHSAIKIHTAFLSKEEKPKQTEDTWEKFPSE